MRDGLYIDQVGNKRYYQNGKLHRIDGPAVIWASGETLWCFNGLWHRADGPALELWYIRDKRVSQEEHARLIKLKGFW